jgi:hypothetical protein
MEEKHIWFTALAVFIFTGLIPPWQYCAKDIYGFIRWEFIFIPPLKDACCVSWGHLSVEWILVWGVAGVLIYLKRKNML